MTEEEYFIKNYPDYCYGNRLLSPYWDLFQDGVEFGERQSEKKIEELEQKLEQTEKDLADYQFNYPTIKELEQEKRLLGERCTQLLKDKGDLTDQIADIKASCDLAIEGRDIKIDELEEKNSYMFDTIALQEQQIDKLKADLNEAIEDANRWKETETFSVLNRIYNDNFELKEIKEND